jgi:hypothetical protein
MLQLKNTDQRLVHDKTAEQKNIKDESKYQREQVDKVP